MTRDDTKNIKYTDPQTLNLYEYCDDNPVSNTDPTGKDEELTGDPEIDIFLAPAEALESAVESPEGQALIQEGEQEASKIFGSFKDMLNDITANPENWNMTGESVEDSTKMGNKGGESIEQEFTNTQTGDTIYKHTLTDSNGNTLEEHYRPFSKQP